MLRVGRNFLARLRRSIHPRNIPVVLSAVAATTRSPPPGADQPLDPHLGAEQPFCPPPTADLPLDPPPSADSSEVQDTWHAVSREKPVTSTTPLVMRYGGNVDMDHNAVLEQLGISILGRLAMNARILFGVCQPVGDDTSLSSIHGTSRVNTNNSCSIVAEYNNLRGLDATDAMYIETIQHLLFPFETVQNPSIHANRTSWRIQRWLGRPMSSKELWHDLPILSPGKTASSTTPPRLAIPDLSYWLSASRVTDTRLDELAHMLSTNKNSISPYLTIEFSRERQDWHENYRMALAGGTALYNRFLLREAALVKQGISVLEEETEHIRHFGITFSSCAHTFAVWLIEPNPPGSPATEPPPTTTVALSDCEAPALRLTSLLNPPRPVSKAKAKTVATATATTTRTTHKLEAKAGGGASAPPSSAWRGCGARSIYSGKCDCAHDMSVLVDWINEIHRWAVEVHAPAVVKDAEVCANHPLPSSEVAPKPSAPAAAVTGSPSLVPQEGHESGGHVQPAISENPWAYT